MWKYLTALVVAVATTAPAQACRVPKIPFNPASERSDVVVIGEVFDVQLGGAITGKWFAVRIETIATGKFCPFIEQAGQSEWVLAVRKDQTLKTAIKWRFTF